MQYKEGSLKHKTLHQLKKIWILNFLRRVYKAGKIPNRQYKQILKWGLKSNEDTNYTYFLTQRNFNYLSGFVSIVTGAKKSLVLQYMEEAKQDNELRQTVIDAIESSPFKHVADKEVRFGRRLGWYAFVRIMKPKLVVETGVDKGLGSVLLCAALLRNKQEGYDGKYYGTDINPKAGYMLTGKYKQMGEILYGDSIESLSKMKEPIELFINDSDHSVDYEYEEYKVIQRLITEKTIILGDNSDISDKLQQFSDETGRHFLFFKEEPFDSWNPGAGIGISF